MKISVCIPTYNGEKYIIEQLLSILPQLKETDEIIVSDDHSTDKTLELIRELNDSRIHVLTNQTKRNKQFKSYYQKIYLVNRNINNALSNANGDIIFLSDQDDLWLQGRVNKMVAELNSADLVVCNCTVVNETLDILKASYFSLMHPSSSLFRTFFKSSFHGCCMAFKSKVLQKSLPIPDDAVGHDTWIGLMALSYFKVGFIEEPLLLYRMHSSNASNAINKSNNSISDKILYRIKLLTHYLKRRLS